MLIDCFISGTPYPDQRPRVMPNGGIKPNPNMTVWKALVAREARRYMGCMAPMTDGLELDLMFFMPMPESWPISRKAKEQGHPKLTKPDVDNLAKGVMDACNSIFWADDKQIFTLTATKRHAAPGREGVRILADVNFYMDGEQ